MRALTDEEQALYDRQIRLWGEEAQRRLATASVLLIGDARTVLVQELAKNVVLTGIARLTLHTPPSLSTTSTPPPALLGTDDNTVMTALRAMNRLVEISTTEEMPDLASVAVVCAVALPLAEERVLGSRCHVAGVPYLCGRTAGAVGWVFVDCGKGPSYADAYAAKWGGETKRSEFGWHVACTIVEFEDRYGRLPDGRDGDMAKVVALYSSLTPERSASASKIETVLAAARAASTCLPPVAAIVGGLWGRETIKLVSGAKDTLDNFFFFNAATSTGSVERVGAKLAA